jgi:hypothetical protein
MFDWQVLDVLKYVGFKIETIKKEGSPMQFLALIEAVANMVSQGNVAEAVSLVEKLVALGEQIKASIDAGQKPQ